jgi:arginase family enzyme
MIVMAGDRRIHIGIVKGITHHSAVSLDSHGETRIRWKSFSASSFFFFFVFLLKL